MYNPSFITKQGCSPPLLIDWITAQVAAHQVPCHPPSCLSKRAAPPITSMDKSYSCWYLTWLLLSNYPNPNLACYLLGLLPFSHSILYYSLISILDSLYTLSLSFSFSFSILRFSYSIIFLFGLYILYSILYILYTSVLCIIYSILSILYYLSFSFSFSSLYSGSPFPFLFTLYSIHFYI